MKGQFNVYTLLLEEVRAPRVKIIFASPLLRKFGTHRCPRVIYFRVCFTSRILYRVVTNVLIPIVMVSYQHNLT